jgi:methylenetetrahydrofolate reductase (NADPH)
LSHTDKVALTSTTHKKNPEKKTPPNKKTTTQKKIDAGGDFIVTQLFYDTKRFLNFVKDCRALGITAPILPGVMPIMTYGGFKRMTGFCKTDVPRAILDQLEAVKDDEDALRELGIKLGAEMCRELLDSGLVPGLHMYSLNLERSAVAILEEVGVLPKLEGGAEHAAPASTSRPPLPWRCVPRNSQRALEGVRPIHWSNRPRSYHHRTADWDRFPSGRWGDSASPGYGTLAGYPFMRRHGKSDARRERALAAWGKNPTSIADVRDVFVRHCTDEGLPGGVGLPWAEMEGGAAWHAESAPIRASLAALNRAGYLTINSQPAVDGARSDDPVHGWGPKGGRVYQKAYVEAFVAPEKVAGLLDVLSSARGGDGSVTYLAIDAKGTELRTNAPNSDAVNAVTWGVFPSSEVLQPTVVDPASFAVWKDEAFAIWRDEWASLYDEGSEAKKLLEGIADSWWLVSVVDNDYVEGGDLCSLFGVDATGAAVVNGAAAAPAIV